MATIPAPPPPTPPALPAATQANQAGSGKVSWAGLIIIYMSIAAFLAVAYLLYKTLDKPRTDVASFLPEYILATIGVFTALLGVKLVRAGGVTPSDPLPVVNEKEWQILAQAIRNNQNDPIGEFIRLSSLTGLTGVFTKLGMSGLPLATIGLTIFFAVMSIWVPGGKFYELTQLTLGAFIGSFVQRQVTALRESQKRRPEERNGSSAGHGNGNGGSRRARKPGA